METEFKGKVLIHSLPTLEAAQEVYKMLRQVHPEAGKERLLNLMRQRPIRLIDAVSADEAMEVVDHLKSFGMSASFELDPPTFFVPEPVADQPELQAHLEAESRRTARQNRIFWIRQGGALALILIAGVFALRMFNPMLANTLLPFLPERTATSAASQARTSKVRSQFQEPRETKLKLTAIPEFVAVNKPIPGLLQVPAGQMYEAFQLRYRLQPDVRFAMALRYLSNTQHDAEKRLRLGEMQWNRDTLLIPLLKKDEKIDELRMALPLTFPRMLEGLEDWMRLLEKHGYSFAFSDATVLELPYISAVASISKVDQRFILNGLAGLDQQWRTGGPRRRLLEAALCGNILLQLTMYSDPLSRTDSIVGESLGMLALTRHGRPAEESAVETALLALMMGYDGCVPKPELQDASGRSLQMARLLLAFLQHDFDMLEKLHDKDPSTMSRYLLARLHLWAKNKERAQELYQKISKDNPHGFPWICDSFYSCSLNVSKQTTLTYPLMLLNQVVPPVRNSPAKAALMKRYAQALYGESADRAKDTQKEPLQEVDITFEAFDKLLAQWQPFKDSEASGYFVDNDKARLVMRTLYEGAMAQRFKLLYHNWNVVEAANEFAVTLLGKYRLHPLAKYYLAQTLIDLGKSGEAYGYAVEICNDGDARGKISYDAYELLQKMNKAGAMAKGITRKLDSRPEYQELLGNVFFYQRNPNIAAAYYRNASNPMENQLSLQENLREVTKSDAPLLQYAAAHPDDCDIQSAIGEYFTGKKTSQGFARALDYYTRAVALRPDDPWLQINKAWCLRELGRFDEAAAILKDAISLYPRHDLTYTQLVVCLAKDYLAMGDAALAVETVKDEIASYMNDALITGARAYEQAGDLSTAQDLFQRAAERYPTSADSMGNLVQFYWKQGKYAQAAAAIKQARTSDALRYDWYFKSFIEVFKDLPKEKGLEAFTAFADAGRPGWEVDRLAKKLAKNGQYQLAYDVASLQMPVNPHELALRYILLESIGRELPDPPDIMKVFQQLIDMDSRKDRLQNMLMVEGEYALALQIYKDAASFDNNVRHAIMLNNLICWLRMDKQPPELEQEFVEFFKQERDSYLMLPGRFLLGLISRDAFLEASDTASKRCMTSYFIGLQERLKGNFDEAAIWYQMCCDLEGRVYERNFAVEELRHWFDVGTSNLARMNKADVLPASKEL